MPAAWSRTWRNCGIDYYEYVRARYACLLERVDEEATKHVYIQRTTRGLEPYIEFVFSDKGALDTVRFRHFFS
ncbi:MAG: hypothetical protein WBM84_10225, partial [Sedimenticolaceae bacterium]